MKVSRMLGATMVAGALATGGAVAGIAGAAAAPSARHRRDRLHRHDVHAEHHHPATPSHQGQGQSGSAVQIGLDRQTTLPEHGLGLQLGSGPPDRPEPPTRARAALRGHRRARAPSNAETGP